MKATKSSTVTLKQLKRESKSFEASQQAFLIALLNINGYGIRVKRPERRSQKTLQLLLIDQITCEDGIIPFEQEIDDQSAMHAKYELEKFGYTDLQPKDIDAIGTVCGNGRYDQEKLKQVKRHRDANRSALGFSYLLRMAEGIGYNFKRRSTKPAKLTVKMEKICSMSGRLNVGLTEIKNVGEEVNKLVFTRFDKACSSVDLLPMDKEIMDIWNKATVKLVRRTSVVSEPIKAEPFVKPEPSLGAQSMCSNYSGFTGFSGFTGLGSTGAWDNTAMSVVNAVPGVEVEQQMMVPSYQQQPQMVYQDENGMYYGRQTIAPFTLGQVNPIPYIPTQGSNNAANDNFVFTNMDYPRQQEENYVNDTGFVTFTTQNGGN
ncbi:hypothetical protein EIN_369780 [Entamoeba invadens IP1]|uniref:Uncharacterized protein n=1 Tax=Entamoeba invadens IP1 TaxID=370355 RepID=A0A0A1UBQ5_ENTIV|nr:hypothetical protein EIN_369780 [Entamoeba invadens IP1]ELP92656.1 hypothetical protein EIN_369780 [Entamoeba invadens IP1]|eukprot:XP_004259427.1 hypothetical protein EIN_369780 [Entamoeba invadens IP1]